MSETIALWITGCLSVAAIMTAPLTALYVQRKRDEEKASRDRRETIFKALWVNRRRQFWVARIDALNMVDIEFVGERKVLDAWQELRAHYFKQEHPGMNTDQVFNEREELFASLVYEISQVLGYKFSRTNVRDNIYRPILHDKVDSIEMETRQLILDLLKSDALPVRFVNPGNSPVHHQVHTTDTDADAPNALKL